MSRLGVGMERRWADMARERVAFDEPTRQLLTHQIADFGGTVDELAAERDRRRIALIRALGETFGADPHAPPRPPGGSYRATLSLTRIATWILSLGVFERDYAQATALAPCPGSPHARPLPDILLPRGSSAPRWLPHRS
ncbi:hypothetical protein AB0D38_18415 [Streptomyces sp. NPDC048279]|uniref:hypothetical protein n=1 Tax=Streptomyces sp. NPDC048279 TaxID=3154714 RepID=UPI0034318236